MSKVNRLAFEFQNGEKLVKHVLCTFINIVFWSAVTGRHLFVSKHSTAECHHKSVVNHQSLARPRPSCVAYFMGLRQLCCLVRQLQVCATDGRSFARNRKQKTALHWKGHLVCWEPPGETGACWRDGTRYQMI